MKQIQPLERFRKTIEKELQKILQAGIERAHKNWYQNKEN